MATNGNGDFSRVTLMQGPVSCTIPMAKEVMPGLHGSHKGFLIYQVVIILSLIMIICKSSFL